MGFLIRLAKLLGKERHPELESNCFQSLEIANDSSLTVCVGAVPK